MSEGPRRAIRALSQMPPGTEYAEREDINRPSNQVISPEMLRLLAGHGAGESR